MKKKDDIKNKYDGNIILSDQEKQQLIEHLSKGTAV
jgi:hypothetical protein